jgi:hypothetical protein
MKLKLIETFVFRESLKCFQSVKGHQPFTRVPSFPFLQMLYDLQSSKNGTITESVRNDKIFYVLNPDNNLAKTQVHLMAQRLKQGILKS